MDKAFFEAFKCFEPKTDTNNEDNPNTSFIECDINVKAQNTDISQEFDEQKIDIKSCKSMERISQILTYYIQWTNTIKSSNNTTPSIGMFDIINSGKYLGSYSNTQLLNDFHHILQIHNYDTINTLFINDSTDKQCILTTNKICQLLLRNYRNRNTNSMDNKQRKQLYYGSNISTEITTQQILDYIHCFIYHSYDLGFKLNPIYSSMYNDHLNNYKNQLLEVQNIEYSKTPQPPIFNNNINRKSIIYNQKIDINSLPNDASDSNSHSDSEETEDSLSVTPQPPEYDEKKDVTNIISANSTSKSNKSPKLSSNLTPSLSPTNALINSNTFLKPGMDSMILSVPQTMQNMKETQSDNDSKLKQHLKLSNSKIIIIKQIMDQINDKSNQLYAPYSRHRYCIYYAGYILGTLCRISESMCNKILNEPQFVSSILSLWKGSSTWMESTCATKAIVYIMQHKPKAFITHKDAQNVNIITSAIDLYINCVKSVLKTCIVPDKMNGLVIDLLNITRGKMYEHDYNVLVERSWIKSEDWSALNLQILYRLAETNDKSIMDMFESVTTAQWEDACGMALCWIWCGELKIRLNSLDLLIYVTKHEKCAEIISKSDLIIKCLIMKLYSRTCMHKRYD
eukprot:367569_1